jgi:protein-S-isoprenylcysteine O-methyltransferase Ste14
MRHQPWDTIFLIGFIVYLTVRGVYKQRTKKLENVVSRVDTQERILMFVVIGTSFLLPLLYLFTPWLGFAEYPLPEWALWCGTALMIGALWLFWRSHADLGRNWSLSLEVRKDHRLITHGVYRSVRHPMYAAIFLWSIAQGLLLQNWLAGWSSFATFTIMYILRTPREEKMMCDFFGQEYRDYMEQTGRLFPRIRHPQRTSV